MSADFSDYLVSPHDSDNGHAARTWNWISDDVTDDADRIVAEQPSANAARVSGGSRIKTCGGRSTSGALTVTSDFDENRFMTPQRKTGMSPGGLGSPDRNRKFPKMPGRIHIREGASGFWSVEDLSLLLEKVKSSVTREMRASSTSSSIEGDTCPGECRLPDRWTPDDHVTGEKIEVRRKCGRRGSVKFADEFGLNLNTFVMIPARFATAHAQEEVATCQLPVCATRTSGGCGCGRSGGVTGLDRILGGGRDPGGFYGNDDDDLVFWPDWDYAEIRMIRKEEGKSKDTSSEVVIPGHSPPDKLFRGSNPDKKSTILPETDHQNSNRKFDSCPRFRLCFEQPFADLDNLQRRLRGNFLCLENVRVDDRSAKEETSDYSTSTPNCKDEPGSEQHPRPNRGTTILCSIKVRRSEHLKTVFARCTDNEWASYADLPAQHLSGVNNLGLDYVTFCFAVRKPVQPPPRVIDGPRGGPDPAAPPGPTSAVEFAVCAAVSTGYDSGTSHYWDNNDGANYRIEWYD